MSTQEEKLLIAVSRLRNLLFRDLDAVFAKYHLTSTQFAVLEVLYSKGELCVGDIQRLILGTSGNVPLVIKNLEKDGLVLRKKSEQDGRISNISLSEKGLEIIQKAYPEQQDRLTELFKHVDSKAKKDLTKDIQQIYQAVLAVKEEA